MADVHSIIFCGTPDFAVPSLEALIADPAYSVDLVITQPDKPVGRKKVLTASPVKECAMKHNIPVFQPVKLNKEFSTIPCKPDYIVVIAYGQILSQAVLDFPTIAPINIHASLLPKWRGASPIHHAILSGDTTSGVTIQRMVRELDAGPILAQTEVPLSERETTSSLHDTLSTVGASLLVDTLKKPLQETEQPSEFTECTKLTRKDGVVDPLTMSATEIDRKVRALVPWPGVRCTIDGHDVKLLDVSLETAEHALPLDCANNTVLSILELQPPGKKPMTGAAWARGH